MLCAKFCSFRSLELSRAEVWIEGIDRKLRLEYSTEKRKRFQVNLFGYFCNYSLLSTKVWSDSINFRTTVYLVLFPEKWFERLNPKWYEADGSDHQIDRCLSESNLSLLIVSLHLWHISCKRRAWQSWSIMVNLYKESRDCSLICR